jgi:hypothetical protein
VLNPSINLIYAHISILKTKHNTQTVNKWSRVQPGPLLQLQYFPTAVPLTENANGTLTANGTVRYGTQDLPTLPQARRPTRNPRAEILWRLFLSSIHTKKPKKIQKRELGPCLVDVSGRNIHIIASVRPLSDLRTHVCSSILIFYGRGVWER